MTTRAKAAQYIALLRGINVGGKNRLPMATLRGAFADAGAAEVATYIQSGNVLFSAPPKLVSQITAKVTASIAVTLEREIPIVIRTASAFAKVAHAHPFAAEVSEAKLLMVAFLDRPPSAAKLDEIDMLVTARSPGDRLEVRGQEVYLGFPNGSGRSKLDAGWLDRRLGVVSTWRNWLTVQKLVQLSSERV